MPARRTVQEIIGYVIGGSFVLILLPYGLYLASANLDHHFPGQLISVPVLRLAIAIILVLVGLAFGISSNVIQNVKGQGGPVQFANVEISPKTRNLVVSGPYRYTRNPMLFGTCLVYYALAIFLDSIVAFLLVTLFMVLMLIFVKLSEEPRLLRDFGSEYEEYRRRVSIFVPWPRK